MKISKRPAITKIIPINKLVVLSAVCALMLACTNNASADAILGFFPDTHVVGTLTPGAPADPADVATYINFMIALSPGGSGTFAGQDVTRTTNLFGSLPQADGTPTGGSVSGTGTSVDLGGDTFTYLFAKYDGKNDRSVVWNISDLTGVLTIPADGPLGYGLSGWILFGPGGGNNTPDSGTAAALLGLGLTGLAGLRARFGRK